MSVAQSSRYNENSKGSWYSIRTNYGTRTASGIALDDNVPTIAHKTLPLGTVVRVTNLSNGRYVVAKVTDRGPYVPNRAVDLSLAAFRQIASPSQGVIRVNVRTVAVAR